MENKKNLAVIIAVVAAIVIAASIYWWSKGEEVSPENLNSALQEATIETSVAPPSANPFDEVSPNANPVEKTNPFKYENPFE